MSFFARGGGNNPRWGRDSGSAPPIVNQGRSMALQQPLMWNHQPFHLPHGYPFYNMPTGGFPIAQIPHSFGFSGSDRLPQPRPVINPDMPAAHMTNSTGGLGCEPGYNYFFPGEHTKIHVLKTGSTPPWQFPRTYTMPFHACHVPVRTTVGELLHGFGATNPVSKLNKVVEVTQGENGRWYSGLSFSGDEKQNMAKTLKEVGWDKTRSGHPGCKPVVHLYITKD